MANFHELEISEVRQETQNSVSIAFNLPDALSDRFSFIPGQYLTLRANIDSEDFRRSYSICSKPDEALRVGIKHVEGGKFSTFAQSLKAGDRLSVMPPEGRFTLNENEVPNGDLLLICSGSGITPILSIAAHQLASCLNSQVTLVYGNQTTNLIMFRRELEILKDQYLTRFHVHHILSREMQDVDLFSGRIDAERIGEMIKFGLIAPEDAAGIFICGPQEMSENLQKYFIANGINEKKVHVELFNINDVTGPVKISKAVSKVVEEGVEVEIVLDGIRRKVLLTDERDTVLTAAQKSGLELPFSCAGGMCATCRCKLIEGDAQMDKHYSLADWELAAGFVLSCQLRPKSEKLILDFDAT